MATGPTPEVSYTGDGSTTDFAITFDYAQSSEVYVSVDGVDTPFEFVDAGTVRISPAPLDALVRVYRSTDVSAMRHNFTLGAPFVKRTIDENNEQVLQAVQEIVLLSEQTHDLAEGTVIAAASAEGFAAVAEAAAAAASADAAEAAESAVLAAGASRLEVHNNTGATLLKGKVVHLTGATGQRPTVALAAAGSVTCDHVIGLVRDDIPNNTTGYVQVAGTLADIDTSAYADGDELWLSAVAGELTNVAPSEPRNFIHIGHVTYAHATHGAVLLHIVETPPFDVFPTLEAFRLSECGLSTVTVTRAVSGGPVLNIPLVATGTTSGTPTDAPDLFSDLADGEIVNAGGVGYALPLATRVYPQTFGAVGENAAVDTPATQLCVNYVSRVGSALELLPGNLYINQNIKFPLTPNQKVSIKGPAKWNGGAKLLVTDAACTRLLEFANVAEAATHIDVGLDIEGVCLDGNNLCAFGIWGAALSHASAERAFIQRFTALGVVTSGTISAAYCNRFSDVVFYGNGQGCLLGYSSIGAAAANNNVFYGCKFWLNGTGAEIAGGYSNCFRDCLFESNSIFGAVVQGAGIKFDTCYFENNSATGFNMTTPAITLHTDIYVKGGSSNSVMAVFAPTTNLEIVNCSTYVGDATNGCLAYIAACQSARFINNHCNTNRPVPMVRTYFNNAYSRVRKLICENNENFTEDLNFVNYTDTILPVSARELNWYRSDRVVTRNYAERAFASWTFDNAFGGNGGTWSSVSNLYRGMPVYQLAWSATSLTYYARFALDATEYPELAGKKVAFSLAMKASGSGALVTFTTTNFSAQASIGTSWGYHTSVFEFPVSGTVNVGFAFTGLNGNVQVASPLLYEVGADAQALAASI